MRSISILFVVPACLECGGCIGIADALLGWKVHGAVVHYGGGEPLSHATCTVELERAGGSLCKASGVKTDAQGRFQAFCITDIDCRLCIWPVCSLPRKKLGEPPEYAKITMGDGGSTRSVLIRILPDNLGRIKRGLWLVPYEGDVELGTITIGDED